MGLAMQQMLLMSQEHNNFKNKYIKKKIQMNLKPLDHTNSEFKLLMLPLLVTALKETISVCLKDFFF